MTSSQHIRPCSAAIDALWLDPGCSNAALSKHVIGACCGGDDPMATAYLLGIPTKELRENFAKHAETKGAQIALTVDDWNWLMRHVAERIEGASETSKLAIASHPVVKRHANDLNGVGATLGRKIAGVLTAKLHDDRWIACWNASDLGACDAEVASARRRIVADESQARGEDSLERLLIKHL